MTVRTPPSLEGFGTLGILACVAWACCAAAMSHRVRLAAPKNPCNDRLLAVCKAINDPGIVPDDKVKALLEAMRAELADPTEPFIGLGGGIVDSDYELYNMMVGVMNKSTDLVFASALHGAIASTLDPEILPMLRSADYVFSGDAAVLDRCVRSYLNSYFDSSGANRMSILRSVVLRPTCRALELLPGALVDQRSIVRAFDGTWTSLSWNLANEAVVALGGGNALPDPGVFAVAKWDFIKPLASVVDTLASNKGNVDEATSQCIHQLTGMMFCDLGAFLRAYQPLSASLPEAVTTEVSWFVGTTQQLEQAVAQVDSCDEGALGLAMAGVSQERWEWVLKWIASRRSKVFACVTANWIASRDAEAEDSPLRAKSVFANLVLATIRSGAVVSDEDRVVVGKANVLSQVEGPDGILVSDPTRGELIQDETGDK